MPHRPTVPREVWVLVAASFVIALGYGIVAPVLPLYAQRFGVGNTEISAVVSVFAAMRLLFAPASGWLVQRFGEKHIYISGLMIVAVSTGACALAVEYWQLVALRAVAGIGSTMFTVSAMGLLIRISPASMRARISSLYSGSFLIGGVAGPILGALVAPFGLQAPFVIYAITLFAACAVVAIALGRVRVEPGDEPGVMGTGIDVRPVLTLAAAWARKPYRAAVAANFANGWTAFGVRVALVPVVMATLFPGTAEAAALALTTFALGNAAIILPAGRWSDRYGRRPFIIGGMALAGVSTALFGFADNLVISLVLCAIAGVGTGLCAPSQQAVVADVVGRHHRGGPVLATFQMMSDLGAVIGPLAIGMLADLAGFGPAFAVTGAILVLAAIVWMFTPNEPERTETGAIDVIPR
ncbi:MFS transporter [Mycetocola tolaasinivorans]|uniref:MFS transporter n=1 Tax=Mycetocola tolaasinivorans TaxID=76635 RepID=A0A3L7A8B3_9MICO|nr:MFS transporter [Mycetocola tolaasinivorans]RLP76559.1 MFS transporter [Mycetocola tolaasinivorans]